MTDHPDDNLAELFEAVLQCRPPHMLAARWFTQGVLAAARDGKSLDAALGLSGPGQRQLTRRLLTVRRNNHLRDALEAVGLEPDLILWQRCRRLAPLMQGVMQARTRFEKLAAPADDWPSWKFHVWCAVRCGIGVPTTADGLLKAVDGTRLYSVDKKGASILARYI